MIGTSQPQAAAAATPDGARVRRVILVVLDGLRGDAIAMLALPTWSRLARSGASTLAGATVLPSVTAAAVASLLTGVAPTVHGLASDRFHVPHSRGPIEPLPALLTRAGLPTSAFLARLPFCWRGVARRIATRLGIGSRSFSGTCASDILHAARAALARQRTGLILLHWPDADRAGHRHGWMSPPYLAAAGDLDEALGRLVALTGVLDEPSTLLIALADHGGGGFNRYDHDSAHPLDRSIPVLLCGGGVARTELRDVSLLDIPATILWALGLPIPAGYAGRPLRDAFGTQRAVA